VESGGTVEEYLEAGVVSILKPEWSALDYIEVPNEKWYLHPAGNELYQFDNGIFVAHSQIEDNIFEAFGQIKVLPGDAKVVEVEGFGTKTFPSVPCSQLVQGFLHQMFGIDSNL
jgi:hypothetical protein